MHVPRKANIMTRTNQISFEISKVDHEQKNTLGPLAALFWRTKSISGVIIGVSFAAPVKACQPSKYKIGGSSILCPFCVCIILSLKSFKIKIYCVSSALVD